MPEDSSSPIDKGKEGLESTETRVTKANFSGADTYSLKFLAHNLVTIRDDTVGETFHPVIGPMAEARQLYIKQTVLDRCWQEAQTETVVVWDVGLGAAANACAVIESWLKGSKGNLVLESFDRSWGALRFALEHAETYPETFYYLNGIDWVLFMETGSLSLSQGERSLSWKVYLGDFLQTYVGSDIHIPDLIMYDLYSARKCPELYTLGHWEALKQQVGAGDCTIIFHSRSTSLRVTLLLAGWFIGKGVSLGEKEETTVASTQRKNLVCPLGDEWLGRVKRSKSAMPILGNPNEAGPISSHWLKLLEKNLQRRI